MPTNTSNAVGTSQQFLPQEPQLYSKQLNGVQLQWNVTQEKDYGGRLLGEALLGLGDALDAERRSKEKRMQDIAEAVAPKAYGRLSEDERKKMDARAILMESRNYDLIDNPYALAKIDSLKGAELSSQMLLAYQDKLANEQIKPSLQEQVEDLDNFTQDYIDKNSTQETISNPYAFNASIDAGRVENSTKIAQDWYQKKSAISKLEQTQGFKSFVASTTRSFLNMSQEDKQKSMQNIIDTAKTLHTGDLELTAKEMEFVAQAIAQNGGTAEDLDYLGSLSWSPSALAPDTPRTVGSVFPIDAYKDLANQYGSLYRSEAFVKGMDAVKSQTTEQGIDQALADLKKSDPETFREVVKHRDRLVSSIKTARSSAIRKQVKQVAKQAIQVRTVANLKDIADAIERGDQATSTGIKVPMTDSDIKAMGFSPEMFKQAMQAKVSNLMKEGKWEAIPHYINNPVIGKDTKAWLNSTLDIDLRQVNNGLSNSVKYGLNLANNEPHLLPVMFGADQVLRLQSLNDLINNIGIEQGTQMYANASLTLEDSDKRKALTKEIDTEWKEPEVTFDAIGGRGKAHLQIDSRSQKILWDTIHNTALLTYASGNASSPEQAIEMAKAQVASNYYGVHSTKTGTSYVIPKYLRHYVSDIFGGREMTDETFAATFVGTFDKVLQDTFGSLNGLSIEYDNKSSQQNVFIVRKLGTLKSSRFDAKELALVSAMNWDGSIIKDKNGQDITPKDVRLKNIASLADPKILEGYEQDEGFFGNLARDAKDISIIKAMTGMARAPYSKDDEDAYNTTILPL